MRPFENCFHRIEGTSNDAVLHRSTSVLLLLNIFIFRIIYDRKIIMY